MDDHKAVYEALLAAQEAGEPVVLVTVIATQGSMPRHAGSKMLVHTDRSIVGTIGGGAMEARAVDEALAALADGKTRIRTYTLNSLDDGDPGVCGGTAQVFFEPTAAPPTLLVIGGHVGKALAELGKWAGYRVAISDDRVEFCNPDYLPGMDAYIVCPAAEITEQITIGTQTYVAAVTRGLPVDLGLIPALLATPAPYIGVIGSRRRWALTAKALQEQHSIAAEALRRIHAPIGLELQAETPKEIALSILAEIVMVRRGGTGQPMSVQEQDKGFFVKVVKVWGVKILCVSDTVMPQMESAANLRRRYHDVSLVISCGDMSAAYLEFIVSVLNVPLFYVRGNHDENYVHHPPGGEDLHRRVVEYQGLTFAGLEGSMRYNEGNIQYNEWEMQRMVVEYGSRLLVPRVSRGHGIDVLVTHSPAKGIHDEQDLTHRGFEALLKFMRWYRPRYMLHGHVHTYDRRNTTETKYYDTCVMNINPVTVLEIEPLEK